jgi:hypothetical protein
MTRVMKVAGLNCSYCSRPIDSRGELVLGGRFWWNTRPYHKVCINHAKYDARFPGKPSWEIPPSQFTFYGVLGVLNIIVGIVMILWPVILQSPYFGLVGQLLTMLAGILLVVSGTLFRSFHYFVLKRYDDYFAGQSIARVPDARY